MELKRVIMKPYILKQSEKKEIENLLKNQFGIKEIPGMLIKLGGERIFLFQGDFTREQIRKLEELTQIERIGFYIGKIIKDKQGKKHMRLSIEASQILKNQILKNIFELNKEQAEKWMMGQELYIKTGKRCFLIMKYKEDFLGTGKASEEKIGNFIPKSRRLKSKSLIK